MTYINLAKLLCDIKFYIQKKLKKTRRDAHQKHSQKTGKLALGSALVLSLGTIPSTLSKDDMRGPIRKDLRYAETKNIVQQESIQYKLKLYLLGFEIVSKTIIWKEKVSEDSQKIEHEINTSLRATKKYWGSLSAKKIEYKNAPNLEDILEEFSYSLSDGEKIRGGMIKLYANRGEIHQDNAKIVKEGKYYGVASLLENITKDNLKVGERHAMNLLFGVDVYHLEYKVLDTETVYEEYEYAQNDSQGEMQYVGRGKSYETCKIRLKLKKRGADETRDDVYIWVGRTGKHKGDIIKLKITYNWAIIAEMMIED